MGTCTPLRVPIFSPSTLTKMNIEIDIKADAGYIKLSNKKIDKTVYVSEYCNVDIDSDGRVSGIELLFISQYMDDFKLWLDLANTAEYLNKSPVTIRRWVKEGKIPYYKPGKEYLFVKEDIGKTRISFLVLLRIPHKCLVINYIRDTFRITVLL